MVTWRGKRQAFRITGAGHRKACFKYRPGIPGGMGLRGVPEMDTADTGKFHCVVFRGRWISDPGTGRRELFLYIIALHGTDRTAVITVRLCVE